MFAVIYLYTKSLHGVRSKVTQISKGQRSEWQVKICNTFKAPKWIGLMMQAYTNDSKTGGRKLNS